MVTMQDVANYAGVSKASVSRVANGLPVSDEIQSKISKAIQLLGYHPNLLARALTTNRNNVIGIIVSEPLTKDNVSTELLSQFLEQMTDLKKTLMIVRDKGDVDSLSAGYHSLLEQRCEGIIYLSGAKNENLVHSTLIDDLMASNDIPMVVIEGYQVRPNTFTQFSDRQPLLITNFYSGANDTMHRYLQIAESVHRTISYFNNR